MSLFFFAHAKFHTVCPTRTRWNVNTTLCAEETSGKGLDAVCTKRRGPTERRLLTFSCA